MAAQAQHRLADEEGEHAGEPGAENERRPGWEAQMRRPQRDRVGADAEEAGMAEAHLAGEPHEDVEPDRGERRDPDEGGDAEIEAGRKDERQQRDHEGEAGKGRGTSREDRHPHTRSTARRPTRPLGMRKSTTRMVRNATASL